MSNAGKIRIKLGPISLDCWKEKIIDQCLGCGKLVQNKQALSSLSCYSLWGDFVTLSS